MVLQGRRVALTSRFEVANIRADPDAGSPAGNIADSPDAEPAQPASSPAADDAGSEGGGSSLMDQHPSEWFAKADGALTSNPPAKLGKVFLLLLLSNNAKSCKTLRPHI